MHTIRTNAIRLVVFDWAGTTVAFGSRAPATAFTKAFAAQGVKVTDDEARAPMGLNKREHLVAMLSAPEIALRWRTAHGGAPWTDKDVDTMYREFVPLQLEAIEEHAELVPRLLATVDQLRSRGLKIGGTTGYFREAAQAVARRAAQAGFAPDANVCADDVPQGRPAPWMIYRVMEQLGIYPPSAVVKVGDTIADIQAGLAAGCWSVGVCDSSSLTGLSHAEYGELSADQESERLRQTAKAFRDSGSHAVINSISDLPSLIDELNQKNLSHPQVLD
ncbi:MAG: phosphonoacetaldehyde hydrolase [Planctomycetia bacterium]|nr:phosphonoacetaldehyde hydrolase [Planctomycetia bacterium]